MVKFVLVHLLHLITLCWSACVFFNDCPDAVKLVEQKRYDPQTITILRKAHCGFESKNGVLKDKVNCDQIPRSLPEGCVPFMECPAAVELIEKQKYDPSTITLLRSAICGETTTHGLILCTKITSTIKPTNGRSILPDNCGIQAPIPKIINGERASFEDFPWIALLQYKNSSNYYTYRCHGTLISKRYVLTAAHCLSASSAQKKLLGVLDRIVLGEYDTRTEIDCTHGPSTDCADPLQIFTPEATHIHPEFLQDTRSDIALIRLNKDAQFSDFVKPVCLPTGINSISKLNTLFVSGWGKTEHGVPSPVKLMASIKYLERQECSNFNIDETEICAGSNTGQDTCKGDSGGPLITFTRNSEGDQVAILAGIVSFGNKCGSRAAVYANVTVFVNWILETIH